MNQLNMSGNQPCPIIHSCLHFLLNQKVRAKTQYEIRQAQNLINIDAFI